MFSFKVCIAEVKILTVFFCYRWMPLLCFKESHKKKTFPEILILFKIIKYLISPTINLCKPNPNVVNKNPQKRSNRNLNNCLQSVWNNVTSYKVAAPLFLLATQHVINWRGCMTWRRYGQQHKLLLIVAVCCSM